MEYDINRELAEDAALDYIGDSNAREVFTWGWLAFCAGDHLHRGIRSEWEWIHYKNGYIAARDAPE